jgi:hypothetical protein
MPEPIQKELYAKAKAAINQKYGTKTSAYRSMALVKKYKSMGGKYRDDGGSKKTTRWRKEEWVDLNQPKEGGGYDKCGHPNDTKAESSAKSRRASGGGKYPLCRPSKTVSSETPKKYQDIPKSRIDIVNLKKQKLQNKGNIRF